ncbi:hypothetical protein [Methylovulum sp.]|uniref:InlB B-repeat-containing protein n=1 Tax=Methylovulum sp. TaxID=1916980 RepID=UPI002618900F|nr:hypothetical protein [Methylovulum sp.]MDD5125839.1 hypothetical protein [Methylovulum sp.]
MRLKPRYKIALKLALSGFLLFGISQTSFAAYTLAVFKHGNAEGKISTANADIDCGQLNGTAFNSCTKAYTKNTNVTLTVTIPTGSRFDGWSGACIKAGLDDKCVVSMSKTQSVTAVFNTPDQPMSIIPMVQGLTLFRDAIKFKVDTDLGTIVTAFAITYDIREAIGWSDWFNVLYNLITTTITELNTFLVDIPTEGVKKTTFMNLMQTAGKGANTSTEFAYGILGLDNLRNAHQGLAVALFPAYSDNIKTMLDTSENYACGGALICTNFQSSLYQESIKNEVGLGTGLVSVLHRRSDITREKSERPMGVEDSKWKIINTVNGVIRALKTQGNLPATFPAASMWTMLRNARQQLYHSVSKPVTVNYTSSLYNPSIEKYIAHKEDVMLGRIAGLFDAQGMA